MRALPLPKLHDCFADNLPATCRHEGLPYTVAPLCGSDSVNVSKGSEAATWNWADSRVVGAQVSKADPVALCAELPASRLRYWAVGRRERVRKSPAPTSLG